MWDLSAMLERTIAKDPLLTLFKGREMSHMVEG